MTFGAWLNDSFNLLKNVPILIHMSESEWNPDSKVVNVAKPEDLQIILCEAKDRFQATVDSKEIYYQRSGMLIGIAITTLTAIIGYLCSLQKKFQINVFTFNLIVIAGIMVYISCKLKNNLKPIKIKTNGTDPKVLYNKDFFIGQPKEAAFMMLHKLIKAYEKDYHTNKALNETVLERLDDCIEWLYRVPVISFFIWIVGALFHFPFFS